MKKTRPRPQRTLDEPLEQLAEGRHPDPFEVLGRRLQGDRALLRVFLPEAAEVWVVEGDLPLQRLPDSDFFEWRGPAGALPERYRLRGVTKEGSAFLLHDPYAFPCQLSDFDLHLFSEGRHWHIYRWLGAHQHVADGVSGTLFAVWAPNALRVSVVGDFNRWDGRRHPMRRRGDSGVWELFLPEVTPGALYKYELLQSTGRVVLKIDPYGNAAQMRPETASIVTAPSRHQWGDGEWMQARAGRDWQRAPLAIYEVHLGSWRRDEGGGFLGYRELAESLVAHVKGLGFTHVELLPITEHPLDASWGYQTTGYFAPSRRFGGPDDLRYLVDHLHQNGIGVLLDWVPAHFPRDEHALARFDGTALYEHEDPRRGEHRDWGTLIFNYGRTEVKNFLLASALYWLEEFHLDGLRVDAVASMLYLDYSRRPGDWLPNRYGGRENLEAVEFLRELNAVTHQRFSGVQIIAEESTAWPQVSRPVWLGGLGFSMKWNMGWMHDTLAYFAKDPVYRHFHHDLLTFGVLYAFSENFVLAFSHDEVVHGKGSLLNKMVGDAWQRFANLRLLYTYLYTHPGKKLLFMGNEFAQPGEWNDAGQLEWECLEAPAHQGIMALVRDLNRLYRESPALHGVEFEATGFEWVDCHDAGQSVLSFLRKGPAGERLVVVLNFTPVPRRHYRIGVPPARGYREILNSDSTYYGGSNLGNGGFIECEAVPWMGRAVSLDITLPPLAALVFAPEGLVVEPPPDVTEANLAVSLPSP
jgi:1,4-alpha-glucan branching enzyme